MSMNAMLQAMAQLSKDNAGTQEVEVPTLVLGEWLTVHSVGFFHERPAEDGDGVSPDKFYGILGEPGKDGVMVRIQNEEAIAWHEGLKEAMMEAGYKEGVLKVDNEIIEPKLKGATWSFQIEPGYIGKSVKYKTWKGGAAFDMHGGMLAGPTIIKVREHRPPKKATYREIRLGLDE